ncbi:MAG: hypothetical protein ABI388_10820 [Bacteroidia bacterium]
MHKSVLLDTSFFIRFLNDSDALYKNADEYFRYFISNNINMVLSTISIAEYCTGGDISELPLNNLQILPFNILHSKKAGEFAKLVFVNKNTLKLTERNIIPNDTKLFAQADTENNIDYYLTSDKQSEKIYTLLKSKMSVNFKFIDISISPSVTFPKKDNPPSLFE